MKEGGNKSGRGPRWAADYFARWLPLVLVVLLAGLFLPGLAKWNQFRAGGVVVYTSQDQVYAEPLLAEFTRQSGLKVRALYDSEAVKTVGLAGRLLAEREHPQCDVFWSSEELRTRQLAARNVFRETNGWAAFGWRSRRLCLASPPAAAPPRSLLELTNAAWRGRVALAYPLFGTTATHFLALRQRWGPERWESWCRALAANRPFLEDGNAPVTRRVARGEAWVGLTDSDDVAAAAREGLAVGPAQPMTEDTLLIPNTVAVIRRAPHPEAAQKLFEFLQRREVAERLIAVHALEGFSASEVTAPTLKPDWDALLRELEPATETLRRVFLR